MSEIRSEKKTFTLDRVAAVLMCIGMLATLAFTIHTFWDVTHGNPAHRTPEQLAEECVAIALAGFGFTLQNWSAVERLSRK